MEKLLRMETPSEKMIRQEDLEIKLIKDAIYHKYGYDFRDYAFAGFKRRLEKARIRYACNSFADLLHRTLSDSGFFSLLLNDLTVTVTELFRDPWVYLALREEVVPHLRTYPEIKVWCAGCSGGEEVYSLAITLQEEGLYGRTILYGTDINLLALKRAREGILSLDTIKQGNRNYLLSGGKYALDRYFIEKYDSALFTEGLREHLVISDHNLVTDRMFGEMQLVLCRNTLIYFNRNLQERALTLFRDSICGGGFLCLGTKETLGHFKHHADFEIFKKDERIYRRKR